MHEPYARFADGKLWLLYLHELLVSIGNQALFECCFVQLNKDVLLCSTTNIDDDNSISTKSLSPSKKRKSETELLQQRLIESKIESVTAFGNKTRKLERISLSRRLNEVMNEYIALNQDIKKMKKKQKQIKKLEEKRKSEGIDNDSDEDSYDSNHHELNIKNTIVKNLKVEINKLQQDIKEIDTNDKKKHLNKRKGKK